MTTPLIGLTIYREEAAWGVWRQRADLLPAQYAEAVTVRGRRARAAAADRGARRGRRRGRRASTAW